MHGPANGLFFAIVYPFLAVIGAPANLLAIVVLSGRRCGLSRCITYYLKAIAAADLFVIITGCILNRIGRIYFSYSVLSTTAGCSINAVLVYAARDASVWLTVAFTIDRFVSICCQSLKNSYCAVKTASLVIGMICVFICVKNVPYYFIYQPLYSLNGLPWFCNIKPNFHTSSAWQAYHWLDRILTPFLPFFLILFLNVLTVRHILAASRARKRLRCAENRIDSEMDKRKRSIVLLFAITFSFLLLWATYIGRFLYRLIARDEYVSSLNFRSPQYILQETTNMLMLLSSCNNIFIYVVSQKMFRKGLKEILMCPFQIFTTCIKWPTGKTENCPTNISHGA